MCKNKFLYVFSTLIIAAALFSACSDTLGREEYIQWIRNEKNGLHVLKKQGLYVFDIQFQPTDYVALQRIGTGAIPSQSEWETLKKSASGLEYYTLNIGCADVDQDFINLGVSDVSEKQQKLYYYSYLFQEDISLLHADNTTQSPCVLYHFEKTGSKGNSRTFVLAFESSSSATEKSTVVIRSSWLDDQPVEIEINKKNIPALRL